MPLEQFFIKLGVPKLQYIPILICEDGSYPVEPNTYVVERCCGEWGANDDDDPVVPTLKSRKVIASRLCAFLRFCQKNPAHDWRRMTYDEHLMLEYQPGLLKGTCSATRKSLRASSVNAYIDEAVLFLSWAAERGHRSTFKVPRRRVRVKGGGGNHSLSHVGKVVLQRHGKMQVVGDPLPTLPTATEVGRWLKSIHVRAQVKALAYEFILRTGARLSETNQLRATCFPNKEFDGGERWHSRWLKQGWVPVTLRYGVKGGKVEPASSLSTQSRIVQVPIDLADRIWEYKKIIRPTLLRRFKRSGQRDLSDGRLWLRD